MFSVRCNIHTCPTCNHWQPVDDLGGLWLLVTQHSQACHTRALTARHVACCHHLCPNQYEVRQLPQPKSWSKMAFAVEAAAEAAQNEVRTAHGVSRSMQASSQERKHNSAQSTRAQESRSRNLLCGLQQLRSCSPHLVMRSWRPCKLPQCAHVMWAY